MLFQTRTAKTKWQSVQIDADKKLCEVGIQIQAEAKFELVAFRVNVPSLFAAGEGWERKYTQSIFIS